MPSILDLANNPLQLGDSVAKLVAKLSDQTDGPPVSIYRMLNASLRQADARIGLLLVKRLVGGFEEAWIRLEAEVQSLRVLRSVADAPDEILRYLQLHLGWTDDLLPITLKLSDDKLRALLAASPGIWRTKGLEIGYSGILLAAMGLEQVFDWDYFLLRWVLDENQFGEDRQGRDTWLLSLPGPPNYDDYKSNLRIVDPTWTADRELAHDLVNLFRPALERVTITWLEFADRFEIDRGWSAGTWSQGRLTLTSLQTALAPVSRADDGGGHLGYFRCQQSSGGASGAFGAVFRRIDADNYFYTTLDTQTHILSLIRVKAAAETVLQTFDFGTIAETIWQDVWYGFRIEVLPYDSDVFQEIRVYIDGILRISFEDPMFTTGRWGVFAGDGVIAYVSDVELMPSPGETTEVP